MVACRETELLAPISQIAHDLKASLQLLVPHCSSPTNPNNVSAVFQRTKTILNCMGVTSVNPPPGEYSH
jgi:hypothetical protein